MKIGDRITDGDTIFIVRSKGGVVQSVNNVHPDDAGNVTITDVNHANTSDSFSKSGNELGMLLWDMFHRYGANYVPSDVSNNGWNSLGLSIIYYTQEKINNQPSRYGQLINIPADKGSESTQLWLQQPEGLLYCRAGNHNIIINNTPFTRLATLNGVNSVEKVNSQGSDFTKEQTPSLSERIDALEDTVNALMKGEAADG